MHMYAHTRVQPQNMSGSTYGPRIPLGRHFSSQWLNSKDQRWVSAAVAECFVGTQRPTGRRKPVNDIPGCTRRCREKAFTIPLLLLYVQSTASEEQNKQIHTQHKALHKQHCISLAPNWQDYRRANWQYSINHSCNCDTSEALITPLHLLVNQMSVRKVCKGFVCMFMSANAGELNFLSDILQ